MGCLAVRGQRSRSNTDMNDEKQDNLPVSETDQQIFDYLDEMLHDPGAGLPVAVQPELGLVVPDNIAHFDVSKKKSSGTVSVASPAMRTAKLEPKTPESRLTKQPEKTLALIDRPALLSESLLRVPEPAHEPEPETKESSQQAIPEKIATSKSEAPVAEPEAPEPAAPEPEVADLPESDADVALEGLAPIQNNQWCDNGRPEWAQSRFECLIFTVNGLKLAVPLVLLGSIHQIDRKFNALPGQYDWFIGILQTPNSGNIKVLDTGLCVMPERHNPELRETLAYVITLHGFSWGLACHQVEKSITLEPDQVKWRTQRGKRPWLAGTVLDYMCSLVDTDGFQDIINQAEQNL